MLKPGSFRRNRGGTANREMKWISSGEKMDTGGVVKLFLCVRI